MSRFQVLCNYAGLTSHATTWNGIYIFGIPMRSRLINIDVEKARRERGHCFCVEAPPGAASDSMDGVVSDLRLFENDLELGPAHSAHIDIAERGAGRFSHWNGTLYFSTSDGSSPCTNARTYRVLITEPLTNASLHSARSSLPLQNLLTVQKGIMSYTYKGVDCYKCPFDLALYQLLSLETKTAHDYRVWYCARR